MLSHATDKDMFDALKTNATLRQLVSGRSLEADCIDALARVMFDVARPNNVVIVDAIDMHDESKLTDALRRAV